MSSRDVIQILRADEWYLIRSQGSHHIFKHPKKSGIVVVPHPKKDLPAGTVNAIFKQAGLK
jgi:predicted RNA binding protein YcfA (HicA-like mRNA interferase family)